MTIWIDAQFSPTIAAWVEATFFVHAQALRDIGLRDAEDRDIFDAAKIAGVVIMTKDADFLALLERLGAPPQIIWITCGNTSNARLKTILAASMPDALQLLASGEPLVEIRDA
jgi:predicted nuclease of predicted toxin-antitoxin system